MIETLFLPGAHAPRSRGPGVCSRKLTLGPAVAARLGRLGRRDATSRHTRGFLSTPLERAENALQESASTSQIIAVDRVERSAHQRSERGAVGRGEPVVR